MRFILMSKHPGVTRVAYQPPQNSQGAHFCNLDEDDAQANTAAAIAIGRELGLRVVAVGVEAEQHLGFLHWHGCDEMQGYLFGRPVPAERFADLITVSVPH